MQNAAKPDLPSPLDGQKSALALNTQALQLRSQNCYAAHPVENSLHALRECTGHPGEISDGGLSFESAEILYRSGTQGLPLSQIPQLPQSFPELNRLTALDRLMS